MSGSSPISRARLPCTRSWRWLWVSQAGGSFGVKHAVFPYIAQKGGDSRIFQVKTRDRRFHVCKETKERKYVRPVSTPLPTISLAPVPQVSRSSALRTHRFERYLVIEDQLLTGSGKLTLRQSRQGVVADFGRHMCCLENILRRGDHIF
jgi:hypothetical protein